MGKTDYLDFSGNWNAICDRCGFKFKATEMKEEWNGLYVCKECWEPRHPQDFLRGIPDDPSVAWTRPDTDADTNTTDVDGNALVTNNANDTVGDVDKTITSTDTATQIWDTTLTADRTATLDTSCVGSNLWDASEGTYSTKSFSIASEAGTSSSLFVKQDGTKFYVLDSVSSKIFQYTMGVREDISTASYDTKFADASGESSNTSGLTFSSDGTSFYTINPANDTVFQYFMTTAWDVSTASYSGLNSGALSEDAAPTGLQFSSDGTKLYTSGGSNIKIFQYTLSTAWDISTTSYASKFLLVSGEDLAVRDLWFKTDGTEVYIVGSVNNAVYQYTLTTAWDISTGSYASKSLDISSEETSAEALAFSVAGTKAYIVGTANDTVYQYTIGSIACDSTAWPLDGAVITIYKTDVSSFNLITRTENPDLTYTTLKTTSIPSVTTFKFNASSWVLVSCTPTGL